MKKKLLGALCISMALAMTIPLAACGNKETGDGPWWSTTGELNKDGDKVVFDDVSIRFTTIVGGTDLPAFKLLINQFNAEYRNKINVNLTPVGEGDFETTVTRQITQGANTAPDLIMTHQRSMKSFLNYKVIQPYDLAMEETGVKIDLSAFAEGVNQYSSVGSEYQYGVPVDAAGMVVYYNTDLLAQYSSKVPKTRTKLMSVCSAYKTATGKMPISWETAGDFFCKYLMPTAVLQNGGYLYKEDLYADWYDNQTQRGIYKDAILSVQEFLDKGYAELGKEEMSGASKFLNNDAIFYVTMPWYRTDILKNYAKQNNITDSEAEDKIGGASVSGWFAMSNETSDNAKKIYGDSHMFAMTKKVKDINQKAAVCEFVKWFTQRADVGAKWAEAGHVTLSNTIANSDEYKNNNCVNTFINNWYPHLDAFTPMGVTPYYMDVSKNLSALLSEAIINGNSDSFEGLIKAKQNALNSQIDMLNMS